MNNITGMPLLLLNTLNALDSLERTYGEHTCSHNEMEILQLRDNIAILLRTLREKSSALEELTIRHIDVYGDIEVGDDERLYVTTVRSHKAVSDSDVLQAVLDHCGGDLSVLASGSMGVLVSNPWKPSAVKKAVGEKEFSQLFETQKKFDVATGKSKRSIQSSKTWS